MTDIQKEKKMNRSQKQLTVLNYLLLTKPKLTVGEAGRILSQWEFKTGNVLSIKG